MYNSDLKTYKYVCPVCINTVDKCVCQEYPECLVQIDKNMVPIIKELNRKWYRTSGCCEGHIGKHNKMYIFFSGKHKFKNKLSKDFEITPYSIIGTIPGKTENSQKRNKRRMLKELYEWACSLTPEMKVGLNFGMDCSEVKGKYYLE